MSDPPPHNRAMKIKKSLAHNGSDQLPDCAVYTLCPHCYTLKHDKKNSPGIRTPQNVGSRPGCLTSVYLCLPLFNFKKCPSPPKKTAGPIVNSILPQS